MAHSDRQARLFTQIAYMELDQPLAGYRLNNGGKTPALGEILSDDQISTLIKLGMKQEELDTWKLLNVHDQNNKNGFYACILDTGDGSAACCFRGSEGMDEMGNLIHDWAHADLGLVNSICTQQHAETERFLESNRQLLSRYDVTLAGHSLGGNLAEYAAVVSENYGLDDNIRQCVSMDGPGFSDEFIEKYRTQIEKMAPAMYHPRWSLVGTMLHDLPGVRYQFVKVSNKANELDDEEYNVVSRHDTKYLDYDENGNLKPGEQEPVSAITGKASEFLDHMPQWVGNGVVTVLCGILIGGAWMKEQILDENGKLTPAGMLLAAGGIVLVADLGLIPTLVGIGAVVTVIVGAVLVMAAGELLFEAIHFAADALCKGVAAICRWTAEQAAAFLELVNTVIEKVQNWLRDHFDQGYRYAQAHPVVRLDTWRLRNYADRLASVNRRLNGLDSRMDSLYGRVGLLDLWNLIQADVFTGPSRKLKKCENYLSSTAGEYENLEQELLKNF